MDPSLQLLYRNHPSLFDGYYILSEGHEYVAFQQERGCRFSEERFQSLVKAEEHIQAVRALREQKPCAKA